MKNKVTYWPGMREDEFIRELVLTNNLPRLVTKLGTVFTVHQDELDAIEYAKTEDWEKCHIVFSTGSGQPSFALYPSTDEDKFIKSDTENKEG